MPIEARFAVESRPGAIARVALIDRDAQSQAEVAPDRGGMVATWRVAGRDLLYLDAATFDDRSKNVRGGNPVLFPSPGKLANDAFSLGGRRGSLSQHGFARTSAWTEVARGVDGSAWVRLALESTPETKAVYPWDFRAELTYRLTDATLRTEIRVANKGQEVMPFGFGFHPYFAVPLAQKAGARIATRARRAWDNVAKKEIDLHGIDLDSSEVDLHLQDHGSTKSELTFANRKIEVEGSSEFVQWVVWTQPGKEFVCLEPWTSPGNALNLNRGLVALPPGSERKLWVEMRA